MAYITRNFVTGLEYRHSIRITHPRAHAYSSPSLSIMLSQNPLWYAICELPSKTQILPGRHNTNSVRVALPAPPSLNTNNHVILAQHAQIDRALDPPLQTPIDVFLPINAFVIGFLLWEEERVDAPVKVGVTRGGCVASDHYDGADGTVFGYHAGGLATGIC